MGGSFLRPSRDGVFPAGLQVLEIVEVLPLSIVYAILIGVAKGLHLDYIDRSEIQLEDRRGGAVRLLDGSHGCLDRAGLRAAAHPAGDLLADVLLHQFIGLARADGVCLACVVPLVGQGASVVAVGHIGGEGLVELRHTVDVHRAGKRVGCILPVDLEGARHPQLFRHCWSTIRRLSFTAVVGIGHSSGVRIDCQNIAANCAIRPSAGFIHLKARQPGEIKGSRCGGNFDGIRFVIKFYFHGGAAIP